MFTSKFEASPRHATDQMKGGYIIKTSSSNSGVKPKPRPLGSVRKTNSFESVPRTRLPPLKPVPLPSKDIDGVSGNAMQVPPPRSTPDKAEHENIPSRQSQGSPQKPTSSCKSTTSTGSLVDKNEDQAMELKESMAREVQLKQQIMQLQKVIDDLRQQVKDKEKTIDDLQKQYSSQEEKYKKLYEREKEVHSETKDHLDHTQKQLELSQQTISDMQERHERNKKELQILMDTKLNDLRNEKDKEITIREEKLGRLKKQMADALKGNSWERQQQLDELTKELSRVQDEADSLRFKIKSFQKSRGGHCDNCDTSQSQLSAAQKTIAEQDKAIKDLNTLCSKFEKQLSQQDKLLRQFAEQKGHKSSLLHK